MDALKFGKVEEQYQPDSLLRDLNKAYTAFYDDGTESPPRSVATGNWGCGAFRGEPRLKFIIQLLACSAAGREMVYFTFGDKLLQEQLFNIYETLVDASATIGKKKIFKILPL